MIIVGSCIQNMQPKAYEELLKISNNIYEVCLEKEHLNMVVTKVIGMLARDNIEIINYVAVDNKLVEIPIEVIGISKNLSKLKEKLK